MMEAVSLEEDENAIDLNAEGEGETERLREMGILGGCERGR